MEIENFSSLVERHEGFILNYFVNGDTNAIAEATNSKIQRMITLNKGIKNKEFFWHKMKKYLTAHQNRIGPINSLTCLEFFY